MLSRKWKALMLALAAVASIYLVRATGLDQGLIDQALAALVEAVTSEDSAASEAAPAPDAQQGSQEIHIIYGPEAAK